MAEYAEIGLQTRAVTTRETAHSLYDTRQDITLPFHYIVSANIDSALHARLQISGGAGRTAWMELEVTAKKNQNR